MFAIRQRACFGGKLFKNIRLVHNPCANDPGPRCDKVTNPPKNPKDDCTKRQRISELRKPKLSFVSMWFDPECCRKYTCSDHQVRYDDLYWRPSDKYQRTYMRTWADCPKLKIVPVDCNPPRLDVNEPEKRVIIKKKKDSCVKQKNDMGLMKCKRAADSRCPKLTMKGCKQVAANLVCTKVRGPLKCKKLCTQYPSFSECKWDDNRKKYQGECQCLYTPSACEILEELKKQEKWEAEHPKKA